MLTFLYKRGLREYPLPKTKQLQIFDLLQFSHRENEYRLEFLCLRKKLHKMNINYESAADPRLRSCLQSRRRLLQKKAAATILAYRVVRRERERLFREYIKRLPAQRKLLYASV